MSSVGKDSSAADRLTTTECDRSSEQSAAGEVGVAGQNVPAPGTPPSQQPQPQQQDDEVIPAWPSRGEPGVGGARRQCEFIKVYSLRDYSQVEPQTPPGRQPDTGGGGGGGPEPRGRGVAKRMSESICSSAGLHVAVVTATAAAPAPNPTASSKAPAGAHQKRLSMLPSMQSSSRGSTSGQLLGAGSGTGESRIDKMRKLLVSPLLAAGRAADHAHGAGSGEQQPEVGSNGARKDKHSTSHPSASSSSKKSSSKSSSKKGLLATPEQRAPVKVSSSPRLSLQASSMLYKPTNHLMHAMYRTGAGGALHGRRPNSGSRSKQHLGKTFRVYGCPLQLANNIYPITCFGKPDIYSRQQPVPYVLTRLCNYIEENSSQLTHEGIFRVSGNAKLMEKLRTLFDRLGDAPLESESVDVATSASMLKMYLRELPEPLIPTRMTYHFVALAKKYSIYLNKELASSSAFGKLGPPATGSQSRQKGGQLFSGENSSIYAPLSAMVSQQTESTSPGGRRSLSTSTSTSQTGATSNSMDRQRVAFSRDLTKLIRKLPIENYNLLKYLACFLYRVSLKQDYNKMCAEALGIVFGPNVFRIRGESYKGLKEQELSNLIMASIISNYKNLFDSDITDPLGNLISAEQPNRGSIGTGRPEPSSMEVEKASNEYKIDSQQAQNENNEPSRIAPELGIEPLKEKVKGEPSGSTDEGFTKLPDRKPSVKCCSESTCRHYVSLDEADGSECDARAYEDDEGEEDGDEEGDDDDDEEDDYDYDDDEDDEEEDEEKSFSPSSGSISFCSSADSESLISSYDDGDLGADQTLGDDAGDEDEDGDGDGDEDEGEEEDEDGEVHGDEDDEFASRSELSASECGSDTSYTPSSSHSNSNDDDRANSYYEYSSSFGSSLSLARENPAGPVERSAEANGAQLTDCKVCKRRESLLIAAGQQSPTSGRRLSKVTGAQLVAIHDSSPRETGSVPKRPKARLVTKRTRRVRGRAACSIDGQVGNKSTPRRLLRRRSSSASSLNRVRHRRELVLAQLSAALGASRHQQRVRCHRRKRQVGRKMRTSLPSRDLQDKPLVGRHYSRHAPKKGTMAQYRAPTSGLPRAHSVSRPVVRRQRRSRRHTESEHLSIKAHPSARPAHQAQPDPNALDKHFPLRPFSSDQTLLGSSVTRSSVATGSGSQENRGSSQWYKPRNKTSSQTQGRGLLTDQQNDCDYEDGDGENEEDQEAIVNDNQNSESDEFLSISANAERRRLPRSSCSFVSLIDSGRTSFGLNRGETGNLYNSSQASSSAKIISGGLSAGTSSQKPISTQCDPILAQMRAYKQLTRALTRLLRRGIPTSGEQVMRGYSRQLADIVRRLAEDSSTQESYSDDCLSCFVDYLSAQSLAQQINERLEFEAKSGHPTYVEVEATDELNDMICVKLALFKQRYNDLKSIRDHFSDNHRTGERRNGARGSLAVTHKSYLKPLRWSSLNELSCADRRANAQTATDNPNNRHPKFDRRQQGHPAKASTCKFGFICPVEFVFNIEKLLGSRRRNSNRELKLNDMTLEQLQGEKLELQKNLLRYEHWFGRPITRLEFSLVGHLYERYRAIKMIKQAKQ